MKRARANRKSEREMKTALMDMPNKQETKTSAEYSSAQKTESTERCGIHLLDDGVMFTAFSPDAGKVQLAGDFNDWQPDKTSMDKISNSIWRVKLPLKAGTYRYRLVVDGKWQKDPCNDAAEPNPYGELNSVVNVNGK